MMARQQRAGRRRIGGIAVTLGLALSACSGGGSTAPTTTTSGVTTTTGNGRPADGEPGARLGFTLSQGVANEREQTAVRLVNGEPIDDATSDAIIARLPEWIDDGSGEQPFAWPVETRNPPRTGATIETPFPGEAATPPVTPSTEPVKVLRVQPDGDVPIAPFVSITFNQPMAPVGTVAQLDQADVPATMTPELPGRWRWVGTRTLRFDYDASKGDRLPMATEYTVTIPAGATSTSGTTLAAERSFTFRTPPVTVQSVQPMSDQMPTQPVFVASFDQRVDPAAVVAAMRVTAGGDQVAVRLATPAEIAADEQATALTSTLTEGRWMAFIAEQPLPVDTAISVVFPEGTPSVEGPLTTSEPAKFDGRTYPPLTVRDIDCGYGGECWPGTSITVEFSTALDAASVDPAAFTVTPELKGQSVQTYGNVIEIVGNTVADTTYTVTIPAGLRDVFGQSLAEPVTEDISIGKARPQIDQPQWLTTLDPLVDGQQLSVYTVGHAELRVQVYSVTPEQWGDYEDYQQRRDDASRDFPDLAKVDDRTVAVEGDINQRAETVIDLGAVLQGKPGHAVVVVSSTTEYSTNDELWWQNRPAATWAQSTKIGVDGWAGTGKAVLWTTDLGTGAPLAGVSLRAGGNDIGVTDADGLASTSVAVVDAVVATLGDDSAVLAQEWTPAQPVDTLRWHVFDDRQVYRPGETVKMKGWVRRLTLSGDAQIELLADAGPVSYRVTDAQGNEIAVGEAELSSLGGFDLSFDVPADANLGDAYVEFAIGAAGGAVTGHNTSIRIDEFRRPEFEVTTRAESPEPYVSTSPATVAAQATYYAGGPLPAAPVTWTVSTGDTSYSPPGWGQYTFGVWTPWWFRDVGYAGGEFAVDYSEPCCFPGDPADEKTFTGVTDGSGTHYLQIDFTGADGALPDLPKSVTADASVTDVNRQTWASSTSLVVHPATRYVGLRSERTFVREGEKMPVQAIVTDIDGAAIADVALTITASRVEFGFFDDEWKEREVDTMTCEVVTTASGAPCEFSPPVGGQYRIRSVVTDEAGGRNRSELTMWVSGAAAPPTRGVDQQQLTVVPNQREYAAGDTAELLVQAPFSSGEGLMTISRNGIRGTQRFTVVDGSAVVTVPIEERDVPGLSLDLEVVGQMPRTADDGTPLPGAPPQPAYAVGSLQLSVPPAARTLDVTVAPRDEFVLPGGATQLDVTVKDASGAPVEGAEFAVVVVDEAVLALSGYQTPDPIADIYAPLYDYVPAAYARQSIQLARQPAQPPTPGGAVSESTAAAAEGGSGADSPGTTAAPAGRQTADAPADASKVFAEPGAPPIGVRTDFDALALWDPSVVTDANGAATIDVTVPDNLTRYRVMVVASAGEAQFGSGDANLTARLPLMVRPSAPRFANFGDRFDLPVVVQNQTDQPMEVDVVLQTANLTLEAGRGQRVTVPANDRVEVRFAVASNEAGTAQFRVAAVSGDAADAAVVSLPVYTPTTAEAFATYGTVDANGQLVAVGQPLLGPVGVVPQFGGLEVTTSSTALQALTDAVLYIVDYEFDSSDGYASQIMSIAALRDVLEAFEAEGLPTPTEMDQAVSDSVTGLAALQNDDGGFPFWRRYERSEPYNTIQAAHALLLAKQNGYAVPQDSIDRALSYLSDIESYYLPEYSEETRDTLSAYALYVRMLAGDRDTSKAADLYERRGDEMPLDALGWLWPVTDSAAIDAEVLQLLNNRAVETAGAANFATGYTDAANVTLQSDRRTDGILLDALITKQPDADLIPKVVTGLLANNRQGRWDNIQENTFILLALHRYFENYETQTPEFVSRVWLGEQYAGEHVFSGRETDRAAISVPMSEVIAAGDTDLVLANDGTGRMYYRIGLRYAPDDLQLDPLDQGFIVDRIYEAVDDPGDVTRDADGTWRIKAGARVRVRLTMVAESQRAHVMLIDPLPAGMEILNPDLQPVEAIPVDESAVDRIPAEPWWWGVWYQHENLRDDRAEAYSSLIDGGAYSYSYVARATTTGTFVVPPTRAEELYAPETFGRSATDSVVVSD
jgi:alpha-2-macroglobulin